MSQLSIILWPNFHQKLRLFVNSIYAYSCLCFHMKVTFRLGCIRAPGDACAPGQAGDPCCSLRQSVLAPHPPALPQILRAANLDKNKVVKEASWMLNLLSWGWNPFCLDKVCKDGRKPCQEGQVLLFPMRLALVSEQNEELSHYVTESCEVDPLSSFTDGSGRLPDWTRVKQLVTEDWILTQAHLATHRCPLALSPSFPHYPLFPTPSRSLWAKSRKPAQPGMGSLGEGVGILEACADLW